MKRDEECATVRRFAVMREQSTGRYALVIDSCTVQLRTGLKHGVFKLKHGVKLLF